MAIQFHNGKILFVDGAIAMDPACCCGSATYTTRAVAHIRGGNGGSAGDWEIGLGTSTSSISSQGHYAWPNDTYVEWSLDYSGAGGDLTLTVGTGSCSWTPGAAIPNDSSNWRLRLEIYVSADTTTGNPDASRLGTQDVLLTIDGDDYPFDDMLVESDPDANMSDSTFILPYQLGNQAWTVGGEIKLGWSSATIPLASRLQAVLRLQQQD
jgi:hypothetical protein